MLSIESLLQILQVFVNLIYYREHYVRIKYKRHIGKDRIVAKTLLLSGTGPKLPVVSANAANFPLVNFLY